MKINVHAGHNPAGKIACGAVGYINESVEDRLVKDEVIRLLRVDGHTVYDCTVDNGTSIANQLAKIVAKCNEHSVDIDVSLHFNAYKKVGSDGKNKGVESLVFSMKNTGAVTMSKRINANMAKLGFTNRGIKVRPELYVLRRTNSKALLVECCFVDDPDDVALYKAVGYKAVARAIAEGIVGHSITAGASTPTQTPSKPVASGGSGSYYKKPAKHYNSLVDGLKSIGVSSTFSNRKAIAKKNGISNYSGTYSQNVALLKLLNAGKLKK